jgi:hypothetical protein
MIIQTYINGQFKSEVTHDYYVNVYDNDVLIDWPGPWDSEDGAKMWAEAIVAELANSSVPSEPPIEE